MKHFACGDVVPGCGHTFTGSAVDDILGQVAAHARSDHGMVEIPDELVGRVTAAIR